jgi:hypothetical protein
MMQHSMVSIVHVNTLYVMCELKPTNYHCIFTFHFHLIGDVRTSGIWSYDVEDQVYRNGGWLHT